MKLIILMTLLLSSGELAQQEVPESHCIAVSDAMSKGETVEIDGTDGQRHVVVSALCELAIVADDGAYDGPCEVEGS